jgi:hypothetical protein
VLQVRQTFPGALSGARGPKNDVRSLISAPFRMFFPRNSHKIVILSAGPHRLIA